MLAQHLSCSSRPTRFVNLSSSVTRPTLPNHSQATVSPSQPSLRQIDPTPKPLSHTRPTPNTFHWTSNRLNIGTFSRAPSARGQRNELSFSSLHSTSTLVSSRLCKHSDASWNIAELWHFEAHRHIMPLCAFSVFGTDDDLLSQLNGTLSYLDSHRICTLQ